MRMIMLQLSTNGFMLSSPASSALPSALYQMLLSRMGE